MAESTIPSRFALIPVTRIGVKRNLPAISATFAPKSGSLILAFSPDFCDNYEAEHGHFRGESVLCSLDKEANEMLITVVEKGTPGARIVAKRQGVEGGAQITITAHNLPADEGGAQITITAHNLPADWERWEGRSVCGAEHTDEGLIINLTPTMTPATESVAE